MAKFERDKKAFEKNVKTVPEKKIYSVSKTQTFCFMLNNSKSENAVLQKIIDYNSWLLENG